MGVCRVWVWGSPRVVFWRRLGEIRNGPSRRGDTSEREGERRDDNIAVSRVSLGSARILIRLVWGTIVRLQIVHGAIAYLSELFLFSCGEGTFQRRREENNTCGGRHSGLSYGEAASFHLCVGHISCVLLR